jgi:phosphoglycerate dehydrogenase-like enzyme
LHPAHAPGQAEALRAVAGLDIVAPVDEDGVRAELGAGAEALFTFAWDDSFLGPSLRWVQALSAGCEQFPAAVLQARGVALTSAGGAHAPAVAEHAIALLLAVTRGIVPAVRAGAERQWSAVPAWELCGLTLGVLGLGSIGEAVARRAAGLGMRVVGTKRDPARYEGVADEVFGPNGTRRVCRAADAVVVALPGGAATRNAVGEPELTAIGEGWLVNVGRGSVVDETALAAALSSGVLRGAALDVTADEPLPASSPLWDVPNLLITPHMAWRSPRLPGRVADVVAANLAGFRGEAPWTTRVV